MSVPVAWINGQVRPFTEAALPVWDLGVVAGASITEMTRTFGHRPFRVTEHLNRLANACKDLTIPQQYSVGELRAAVDLILETNTRLISQGMDLGIVVFVTAGMNPTYLSGQPSEYGTTVVHTFPLPFGLWKDSLRNGVRLRIPSVRQPPGESLPVHLKTRNRLHWWLADREVAAMDPGCKALLMTADDRITETSTACFCGVLDGAIVTADEAVLDSMSRRIVEELAFREGIPFQRRAIRQHELIGLSEAFLTSSPVCLLPVSRIEDHAVGKNFPGPICSRLSAAWNELVGLNVQDQILNSAN